MGLRPVAARWFQVLANRHDLSRLAEALAHTGVVQIEAEEDAGPLPPSDELASLLVEFGVLSKRYQPHWPPSSITPIGSSGPPAAVMGEALGRVRSWAAAAQTVIDAREAAEQQSADLALLAELLTNAGPDFVDLGALRTRNGALETRLHVLPGQAAEDLARHGSLSLTRRVQGPLHTFVLVMGPTASHATVEQALASAKARPLEIPDWLEGRPTDALQILNRKQQELDRTLQHTAQELAALDHTHGLSAALGDLNRLRWFSQAVPQIPQTRNFAVITGWTSDPTGAALQKAIKATGLHALLTSPPPPPSCQPPVVLHNRSWIKPFELFALLLGTPGHQEADPSPALSIVAPLLFGFMFGDVGQGAVLIVVGLLLQKRMPAMRMLIAGGAMAMVFGALFGSVFALENVMQPLWLHPLQDPLPVLGVAVAGGAGVLLLGLGLDALAAHWRGATLRWLATDAAVVAIYAGLLAMLLDVRWGWAALAGTAWHIAGSYLVAHEKRFAKAGAAAAHLVERMLQLVVNTVSFARVGAFALAHAGLCAAVEGLAGAVQSRTAAVIILVAGNAFCLVLEGLVVGIQTTRLVLFEFFVRFLQGKGRAFRPLLPPTSMSPRSTQT